MSSYGTVRKSLGVDRLSGEALDYFSILRAMPPVADFSKATEDTSPLQPGSGMTWELRHRFDASRAGTGD